MKRVLVVNVNWLGDTIFATPVYRTLKQQIPGVHITVLTHPRVKDVLECCPDVDEAVVFDEKGRHWTPWGKWTLVADLRRRRFDAAFLLHRSWTRALLVWMAGIPVRVGYDDKNRGRLLTHHVAAVSRPHRGDHYGQVIESYGYEIQDRRYALTATPEDESRIIEMLKNRGIADGDDVVVVNPGGNWDLKRWPSERFGTLVQRLEQEYGFKVVISGANKDRILAQRIADQSGVQPVVLAGTTTLKQLLALMKRASLVISADSGPLHLAASVGTDVIALFGPTRPEVTGPRGTGRSIVLQEDVGCNRASCYYLDCPDNVCMSRLTVDQVMEAVGEWARESRKGVEA